MKHVLPLAFAAALLFHTDARAMLHDASIEHDLGGVRKSFEAMTLSHSGQAADLRTARAVVRGAETPLR
ncbi:hypothetical protein [Bradyrhizobium commune]|uniref:Uncharacterized protein n=1 Tax=Bradyrhizobium commune TaxID=83627 RepID=A0A7S9D328_9BRAD|nr:hypothetical protein [Bradyrhizobium commune]QPF90302.1 hypothetical protein IC761_27955 [Bradyrhizobium commune]